MPSFEITVTDHPTPSEQRDAELAAPVLGRSYTDHMASAQWTEEQGWHDQVIAPMSTFDMHPASGVFHYAQEIFEGLKAYRRPDGSVSMFRPARNAARFATSAARMSMPVLPEADFVEAVLALVSTDAAWVPAPDNEQSLYVRPFMIADETFLGVRAAQRYRFAVIATPAGPYYPDPLRLWVTPSYTRAAPGGTGAAKCGGNYAASLIAAAEAQQHGCGQVLWLDGAEREWVEECGTMNILFVTASKQLVTPALTDTILDGVTRDSLLQLASEHGLEPVERRLLFTEVAAQIRTGQITEVLACGTAAVVTPITGFLTAEGEDLTVGDGQVGSATSALRQHLVDIQFGRADDQHGWNVPVA